MLAGLAEAGLDLSDADFILGTSAGSVVGSQLAMGRPAAVLASPFLDERPDPQGSSPSQLLGSSPPDLSVLIQKMMAAVASPGPAEQARADIGAWALQAQTMSEDAYIASFGHAIRDYPEGSWPDRFACTAVDTADGAFVVWSRESGVGLGRAVASSCSVPGIFPPVTIRGHRYMDGGMRSATNADMAQGYDVVFVLALTVSAAAASPMAQAFRGRLDAELDAVRKTGSRVELILPDAPSLEAFGLNLMDYRRRPAAAQAGFDQGKSQAGELAFLWRAGV